MCIKRNNRLRQAVASLVQLRRDIVAVTVSLRKVMLELPSTHLALLRKGGASNGLHTPTPAEA